MYPTVLHIYGPLYIQSYGLLIVIGILIFAYLFLHDPKRKKLITQEQFFSGLSWIITATLLGGHTLYVLTEWQVLEWSEILTPWSGLSVLGGIVGGVMSGALYFHVYNIPVLPVMDLISLYLPLVHGFGRIGCFLAGCCYGAPSTLPWSIVYTNPAVEAPVCVSLHPSQLYSSALLFLCFFMLYFLKDTIKKPGQMLASYIILMSIERFITDFWRYDHIPVGPFGLFSFNQWVAMGLCIGGLIFFTIRLRLFLLRARLRRTSRAILSLTKNDGRETK